MELLEKYREYLNNIKTPDSYSDKTIISYCNDIAAFIKYVNKDVATVTTKEIESFLLVGAPSTSRRRFSSILNFYNFLSENGVTNNKPIAKNMYYNVVRQDKKRISVHMTISEGLRFLEEAKKDTRTYAIMMLFLNSGIREAELINLEKEDYVYENGESEGTIRIIAKGDEERIIGVTEGAVIAINKYLETRDDDIPYLFISNKKCKYSPSGIYNLVNKTAERAGINKKIAPHKLRHTFANMMWDRGADVNQIKDLLGHKSLKTTLLYLDKLGIKKAQELLKDGAFNIR